MPCRGMTLKMFSLILCKSYKLRIFFGNSHYKEMMDTKHSINMILNLAFF